MSSDIRKWFMKAQDKNGGEAKKPVLSIPEKQAAPSLAPCDQDCSARRKTSKYFTSKIEKEEGASAGTGTGRGLSKRKLQKDSDELEDDMKPLPAKEVHKDDDDFVAPSKKKTPVKPPPSKKLKAASNAEDHGKTTGLDDDSEDKMDEDAKTPSKAAGRGRGRGRGRGGRGAGAAQRKPTGLDDEDDDKMDEDAKTPSKAAGRGRGGAAGGFSDERFLNKIH